MWEGGRDPEVFFKHLTYMSLSFRGTAVTTITLQVGGELELVQKRQSVLVCGNKVNSMGMTIPWPP